MAAIEVTTEDMTTEDMTTGDVTTEGEDRGAEHRRIAKAQHLGIGA